MLVVKFKGGLGNQMFQYMFYKQLKHLYPDKIVKADIGSYKSYKQHNGYELEKNFNIKINHFSFIDKIIILLKKINKNNKFEVYTQDGYLYDEKIYTISDGILDGYWQSELFFDKVKKTIFKEFEFNIKKDKKNEDILNQIKITNSVSIHIRRGDYITDKNANKLFGDICNLDYYRKSIEYITNRVDNPTFFVFSNDIEWVKQNLYIENLNFINWNEREDSYIDMYLMSKCKHNIIANSSFSWWGAYLNKNENKIVIAPNKWVNNTSMNTSNILPNTWVRMI